MPEDNKIPEEQTVPGEVNEKEKTDWKKEVMYWAVIIVIAFLFAQGMNRFVILNAVVPSGSMEDTIQIGDRLIGTRFAYWFSEPKRGDIIIFDYPVDESHHYIKRVIGLPGEHIDIREGKVYIDGSDTPLEEDYLKEEWIVMADGLSYDVPEGCYFMMGDNRNASADSRYWAEEAIDEGVAATEEEAESYTYVKKEKILAKAVFAYFHHFYIIK